MYFILIAKQLTTFVKNVDIQTSIAPDHSAIVLIPRGPDYWQSNNTFVEDEEYLSKIRELYPRLREKYAYLNDSQLFWELMKMELRSAIISFAKGKAKAANKRVKYG